MAPKKQRSFAEVGIKEMLQETLQNPDILKTLANALRSSIVAELKAALEANTAVILELQAALQDRDRKIMDLESKLSERLDDLEQYQRRQCLRIFGVPENRVFDVNKYILNFEINYK
ncbi:hypothetical protein C0J52_16894 [Blattella germanica]|nr:hypothetical protein C0J52_16894 [Blattella germanica]